MKFWKCAKCCREHKTEDNIIESYCPADLELMEIQPYNFVREVIIKV